MIGIDYCGICITLKLKIFVWKKCGSFQYYRNTLGQETSEEEEDCTSILYAYMYLHPQSIWFKKIVKFCQKT